MHRERHREISVLKCLASETDICCHVVLDLTNLKQKSDLHLRTKITSDFPSSAVPAHLQFLVTNIQGDILPKYRTTGKEL